MDDDKIAAIAKRPTPSFVRALRGFLGLVGYYRKFVRNYGINDAPLTRLFRKNSFEWSRD